MRAERKLLLDLCMDWRPMVLLEYDKFINFVDVVCFSLQLV